MATRRRSLLASGCGCVVALPTSVLVLGSIGSMIDGETPVDGSSLCAFSCFFVSAALGLGGVLWGLSSRPETPEEALETAALRAMSDGSAPVDMPAGTSAADARAAFHGAFGVSPTEIDRRWGAATDLMMSRRCEEAIQAFEQIAHDAPDRAGDAQISVGACLHLMGRYADAIAAYERARALGADSRTVDENIQESRDAMTRR